jgi:hypothetical protein
MEEKKNLFDCKYWSCHHFIALAVPIFCMLTTYLQKPEMKIYNKINNNKKIQVFPFYFNLNVSKLLSLFLILLSKFRSRRITSEDIETVPTIDKRRYHLDVNNKCRKTQAAIMIIFISFLEIIFRIEKYLIIGKSNYIELKLGFIILVPLLSILILKKHFYRHHIISFCTCVIAFVLICASTWLYEERPTLLEQIRHLLFSIPLGLSFVLIKFLYRNTFVDAFIYLFFNGILCLLVPFIYVVIASLYKGSDYFYENMNGVALLFHDNDITKYFFLVALFSFGYNLTNVITIYLFDPSLMVMTDILSPFFRWIIEIINEFIFGDNILENIFIVVLKGSGFLIIIFSSIVFNELLILHAFNLDKNIEANIQKRADSELEENSINDNSFMKDDDTISRSNTTNDEYSSTA